MFIFFSFQIIYNTKTMKKSILTSPNTNPNTFPIFFIQFIEYSTNEDEFSAPKKPLPPEWKEVIY